MKKLFLFATAIVLILASCSNDGDLDTVDNNTSIEFRTLMDKSTKAAITTEANLLSFTVTGIKMNGATPDGYLFDGFGITRGEDENNKWDYSPKRYWPTTGTVNFYAYSPSSTKNITSGITGYDPTVAAKKIITYKVPQISLTDAQEDFLVARLTGQDKNTTAVKLNFHHALSRVMFFAMTTQANITYTIDKIELVNLNETGTLDLTQTSIPESGALSYASTLQPWSPTGSKVNYTVDMGNSPIYLLTSFTSVLGKTNAVMVLPQSTTLYSGTGSTAPSTGQFAIKVCYKAFVDNIYYAGTKTESAVKYFAVNDPVKAAALTFEMGRQYNFMLTFGEEVGDPIKFQVQVSSWDNNPVIHLPEIGDYSDLISNELKGYVPSLTAPITYAKLKAIDKITITGSGTAPDLKGIEYFPGLKTVIVKTTGTYDVVDLSRCPVLSLIEIAGGGVKRIIAPNQITSISTSGGNYGTAEYANGDIFKTGTLTP